ncbi:nucleotide-diphospho-sugar transferase [Dunaliella salina]|uniref:Nucleotide-diphospho-sugar transferase n=1 Tax=Dunaliella salina TaxID=3046 RepID=A0ABQ7GLX4_DUNSA|nr:nucleotide-diphospho-sugar transferase [Dunaliella salina]|eukprot:KAF5835604.1 nucleotide-diphospho-sugar transferase [Dunaliella salina]
MRRTRLLLGFLAAVLVYKYASVLFKGLYAIGWWEWQSGRLMQVASTHSLPNSNLQVPRRIHQTWKDKHVPEQWQLAQASCQKLHEDYEYKLWTDEDAEQLIATKYPWFLKTFKTYPHGIQRADALRYFVLYEYGGIYIDLDIACKERLDFLLQYDFVAPKTTPIGAAYKLYRPCCRMYATVMFSTGPMFVTIQFALHGAGKDLAVLPPDLYGHQSFKHIQGSSWHGSDGRAITWVSHHVALFAGLLICLLLLLMVATSVVGFAPWRRRPYHGYPWTRKFGIEQRALPTIEDGLCSSSYGGCASPKGQHFVFGVLSNAMAKLSMPRRTGTAPGVSMGRKVSMA